MRCGATQNELKRPMTGADSPPTREAARELARGIGARGWAPTDPDYRGPELLVHAVHHGPTTTSPFAPAAGGSRDLGDDGPERDARTTP